MKSPTLPPRAKREARRQAASSPAPKLRAPSPAKDAGPTLDEQLTMSKSETATAREKIRLLEAQLLEAQKANAELAGEVLAAKAAELDTVAAAIVNVGGPVGVATFAPSLVRAMRTGDVIEITHAGKTMEVKMKRPPALGEGSDVLDLFGSLFR